MPRKNISFELDFMVKDIFPRFTLKQLDDVTFTITPLMDGQVYNVGGMSGVLYVGVGSDMFKQDTNITVSANSISIKLDRNMIQSKGRAYAEIELTDSLGTVTSASFSFNVDGKIGEGATIAGEAKGLIAGIEERFNQLTSSQQGSSEVIDARKGEVSLKAKIDKIDNEFTNINSQMETITNTQLPQKADKIDIEIRDFIKYGKIILPNDFYNNINFELWRDNIDGKIKHNFTTTIYEQGVSIFYVSGTGSNGNNGTTESTPWSTLGYAIDTIEANASVNSAKIIILTNLSRSKAQINSKTLTKNYIIEGKNVDTILATSEPNLTYSLDGNSYKATRSSVTTVFDKKFKGEYNTPYTLIKSSSKTECDNTRGSWYTDGTNIWINTLDGRSPDTDIFPCLNVTMSSIVLGADTRIIFKNITFLSGSAGQCFYIYSSSTRGQLILDNVKAISNLGSAENCIEIKGIKHSWLFDVYATNAGRDGINYHSVVNNDGLNSFVFEYNCVSHTNGLQDTANFNNNGSTCHDGIRILRINTIAYNSKGPVIADVNGCYSILIDCVAHDSMINTGRSTKVAYYFDDSTSSLVTSPNGKAILLNCQGGGDITWSINADASFKNEKINVLNFTGKKFPIDLKLKILDLVTM